jgi:hypothetical protein
MSESEEKAEAILIVIKRILKWIGIAIIIIVTLFFLIIQYDEYKINQRKKILDKVSIEAFHPQQAPCDIDFPYEYSIMNKSGRTVEKVSFTVGIKRIGYSSELNRYTSIDEDKILFNNEGIGGCFRAEVKDAYGKYLTDKDVEIVINYKDVTFRE